MVIKQEVRDLMRDRPALLFRLVSAANKHNAMPAMGDQCSAELSRIGRKSCGDVPLLQPSPDRLYVEPAQLHEG
jgi:hypothetical protein